MQTNCLYCAAPFKSRRTTKKYCSPNCKQLAYFKRNGMVFGVNGVPAENLTTGSVKDDTNNTIKDFSVNPDLIKADTVDQPSSDQIEITVKPNLTVKQSDSVKYDTIVKDVNEQRPDAEKEPAFFLNEKQIEQLINGISPILENKIQQEINSVKEELTVKYASLYSKNGLAQNTVSETKTEVAPIKDDNITEQEEKLNNLQFENDLSENTQVISKEKTEVPEPEQKYEWISSKFYENIEDYNEKTTDSFDFGSNEDVNWVNLRLRCVIENMIRLSEFAFIDKDSMLQLGTTFKAIIASRSFQGVKEYYPFTETIFELFERLNTLSETKNQNIPLRISFGLKAKLVSIQNQFKENVPLMRFNEINFAETHRGVFVKDYQTNNQNKKTNNWRERHKQYVEAGLIEPDEDDND